MNKIVNYFLPFREKIENLPPDNNLKSLEKKEQIGEENTNLNVLKSSNSKNSLLSDTESQIEMTNKDQEKLPKIAKPNLDQSTQKPK